MKLKEFDKLVSESLTSLPDFFKEKIENLSIVIESKPKSEKSGKRKNSDITLGLYQGVPLAERNHLYGLVLPDKITIYKNNIESVCRSDAEIKALIRQTVIHEIAHHFGISDERLKELGAY
jgi:predicted Zn-dependent protease with MMP-like domain